MINRIAIGLVLTLLLALPATAQDARAIVGEWQSAPVLGQMGMIKTTMTFNKDGSFTGKDDFISFPQVEPDIEYFWIISNGTYSVVGDIVTLDYDKIRRVRKMRGKDEAEEAPEPVRGSARRKVVNWKDGKLMMKDVALELIK